MGVPLRCAPGRASRAVSNDTTVANGAEPPPHQGTILPCPAAPGSRPCGRASLTRSDPANLDPLRLRQANSSICNGFSGHLEQIMRILREISSATDYISLTRHLRESLTERRRKKYTVLTRLPRLPAQASLPKMIPMSRNRRPFYAMLVAVMAGGCSRAESSEEADGGDLQTASFGTRFELADTVVLDQPDSLPIVRISGFDRRPDGYFVLSDPSEGMVKLFSPDGALQKVVGRKGRGPAEFQTPEFARFDSSGRIHVVDNVLRRLSVFDRAGFLLRSVGLADFSRVTDFEVLPNGDYLLAGFKRPPERNVLFHTDSLGRTRSGHMPYSEFVPRGERGGPSWRMVRRPAISVRGDSALFVLSIADSLWTLDWRRGGVESETVVSRGYVRPYAASPAASGGLQGMMKWHKSFTTTADVLSGGRIILIPFVRGIMNDGDPLTVAFRGPERDMGILERQPAPAGPDW